MAWDLFCRVVDNFGDIGVCWRLAADLAGRGQPVRLWTDDASALAWMAPHRTSRQPGVSVGDWVQAAQAEPGEVVIEAFGCDLPPAYVARMAQRLEPSPALDPTWPPVWINLEYLSAEAWVERSHRLPSPQLAGPGAGLRKHFFYPGFTAATGGLVREPGLLQRQARFDAAAWLAAQGVALQPGERAVSLFCYPQAPVAELIDALAGRPTVLLATAGTVGQAVQELLGPNLRRGDLRAVLLPRLSQVDYDHLLWSCDLNWVRGEDSFVRAQWAARPFVWHIYPQDDGADVAKLQAFLDRFLAGTSPELAAPLRRLWRAWNGHVAGTEASTWVPIAEWAERPRWETRCRDWRDTLAAQPDLVSQLQGFVAEAG